MEVWCICFMSFFISVGGILRGFSALIDCSWMAPLTPAVMVMRGLTVHPADLSVCIKGLYLSFFSLMEVVGNLS